MRCTRPLVAISACRKKIESHYYHVAGEKYITAVLEVSRAHPMLLPAVGENLDILGLVECIDGILLTGSLSNVEPHHYEGPPSASGTLHDPHRDATTLPLIRAAIQAEVPVLAICRGCQEMNVAFGGSLYQRVHEVQGMLDHREVLGQPVDIQYAPTHEVKLATGGLLHRLTGEERITVNSLHWQGIERLGAGLTVEAMAPDGLVEAFRVTDAPAFALAIQWHPEWKAIENRFSRALFQAFGNACRQRAARRLAA